jgi:hypothetical protein
MARFRNKRVGIYKSGTEKEVGDALAQLGIPATYEKAKLPYVLHRKYSPDFNIGLTHHIEVKGYWESSDRSKLLAVIHANPTVRILVALEYPQLTISKKSKTTYSQWCDKHGIQWAPIPIPLDLLAAWLPGKPHTFPAQAQSVTPAMEPQRIQMGLFSVSCASSDITLMGPSGSGP